MGKTVEVKFRFSGDASELDKLKKGLHDLGVEGATAGEKVTGAEKTIARLRGQLVAATADGGKAAKEIAHLREEISKVESGSHGFEGFHERIRANLENPLSSARIQISEMLDELGKGPAIAAGVAVGFGVIAKSAFEMVAEYGRAAQATSNFAMRLGISADAADKLQAAGKLVGIEVGSLEGASRLLSVALDDEAGAGKKTADALKRIGVDTRTATGEQREMGDVLLELLERLSHVSNAAERFAIARQTLGRGAKEIAPLIEDYGKLQEIVKRAGVAFDEGDEKLKAAARQINELDLAWDEFKKGLAGAITPIVLPIVVKITGALEGDKWDKTKFGAKALTAINPFLAANMLPGLAHDFLGAAPTIDIPNKLPTFQSAIDARNREATKARGADFASSQGGSLDAMKKRLEELKKTNSETAAVLSTGGLPDGFKKFGDAVADFNKKTAEASGLEASIKRLEKVPEALKQLAKDEANVSASVLGPITKAITEIQLKDKELLDTLGPQFTDRVQRLFSGQKIEELGKFVSENQKKLGEDVKKTNEEATKQIAESTKFFLENLKKNISDEEKEIKHLDESLKVFTERDKAVATRQVNSQIRMNQLTARPGQEVATANTDYALKVQLARQLLDIEKQRTDEIIKGQHDDEERRQAELDALKAQATYEEAIDAAKEDRENKLLELKKRNLDSYRTAAGSIFDALFSRNAGDNISKLASGFGKDILKGMFENASQGIIKRAAETLGQAGGKLGPLGGLLQGTALDPHKTQLDANTTSLVQLKTSVDTLTSTLTGQQVGAGSVVTAAPGQGVLGNAGGFGSDMNGITGQGPTGMTADGIPVFSATGTAKTSSSSSWFGDLLKGAGSVVPHNGQGGLFSALYNGDDMSTATKIGNVAASAGAVAAGVTGVLKGLQSGGARGVTSAVGSALGVAALVPGPQQPFLMAASMGAEVIRGLLGDPRVARQNQLTRELTAAKYVAPNPINVAIDSATGMSSDTDFRGRVRTLNTAPSVQQYFTPTGFDPIHTDRVTYAEQRRAVSGGGNTPAAPPVIIQVQTMDSKSFMDNSGNIANAMGKAIQDGHRVVKDIAKTVPGRIF